MRISVAMCTYNGARYIEEQLSSIIDQIRLPDEVIICDDGSHDSTIDIVERFANQAPFEIHIHCNKTTLGSTKNFEKAIRLCSGDIIVLCDQDDVWHPQKLSRLEYVFLGKPHVGGIFTNADVVDQNLKSLGFSLWDVVRFSRNEQMLLQKGKALHILLKHLVVTGATLAFRSSFKNAMLPIPSFWMHDAWIALNLSVFSNLSIIQKELIKYRQHGDNQIGGIPKGIRFRINETLSLDRGFYYASELERYEVAYGHFSKRFSPEYEPIKMLSLKIQHLKTRSLLPKLRCLRIPIILKELLNGRYRQFSASWEVAVKDFLIP